MSRRGENIFKRKDGRWEERYTAGHDSETGRAIYECTGQNPGRGQGEAEVCHQRDTSFGSE